MNALRPVGGRPTAAEGPGRQTRIFGIRLGIDPKILVGAIVLVAVFLFWYNSRADEEGSTASTVARPQPAAAPLAPPKSHIGTLRRSTPSNERGTLRLRPVDATRGEIDPTLRLDLLTRLQSLDPPPGGRNLFDLGASPVQLAANMPPIQGPKIPPKPLPPMPAAVPAGPPPLNIPLKFYGFVKPTDNREAPRGFFMDGDDVLVATEGQLLEQRFRVVSLSAASARVEDVQLKQSQNLPVMPEAMAQ